MHKSQKKCPKSALPADTAWSWQKQHLALHFHQHFEWWCTAALLCCMWPDSNRYPMAWRHGMVSKAASRCQQRLSSCDPPACNTLQLVCAHLYAASCSQQSSPGRALAVEHVPLLYDSQGVLRVAERAGQTGNARPLLPRGAGHGSAACLQFL